MVVLLAGRAAEKLIYDEGTVGAENDLERATSMARRMVTHWGMSPKLGPVSYKTSDEDPFLGREMHQQRQFSEHTQEMIDGEVSRILTEASTRAFDLLTHKRNELESVTRGLLDEEELSEQGIEDLIGPSVHGSVAELEAAAQKNAESMQDGEEKDSPKSEQADSAAAVDAGTAEAINSSSDPENPNANGSP